ncbi:MAG TPA: glyceraldehyde 3-phosphate dehydrogenase NAD-binding domain-containing protein [Denitromonas sp.]|uniref:type I glyceraldehyde-3-phosphate dehydrogenase n=1 Tax=Denitromonas sp. TaxID=2734609 RepID=UPI001D783A7B|nr:erythrose-4-phosphate dehydrogenase [Rhodocyclaceae bacterium]MCP5221457.1 erythrose-4-phosphate dehydrogenase [Zoogloeaceae bacterium]HPR06329.1 glyceraldehyde 3-phosphate dehydrogenase NAD-binding domain-containing protein [Denitromonas sp.]HQU88877.1 glyceraldehyde 3-phosphate dehydrogenase NAD-binding domain-containing protein [Denitromonas sp.]HQV15138.1 glyceraldehyde 3-phosphate dehydrogenase NAD-binding domain-containing protein [Denitromonas sp.]
MTLRLAINGYGRIGRCLLRALHESIYRDSYQVVAINEPADLASIEYLTRFDSTHGRFPGLVETGPNTLVIDGHSIAVTHETTPEAVDWAGMNIDLMIECSGHYGTRAELQRFIDAGCPRILLSHPGNSAEDVDATIVFGINHDTLSGRERIVSNASCTTNAVVPVLDLIDQAYGVDQAILTTIHSVMNDQPLIDAYHHTDLRRTRSAMQSIIPVATGLARGVERLLPRLAGRVQAKAIRVPTLNVSAIELALTVQQPVDSAEAINQLLAHAAHTRHHARLAYTEQAHASIDFNHDPHSAVIDGGQTRIGGEHLLSLLIWFDNEWGFASRMVDVLHHWHPSWPSTDSLDSLLENPQ